MRILLITRFHLPIVGGAEITTDCLAKELQGRGHSITVFARQDPRRPPLPPSDDSLGYPTLRSEHPADELPHVLAAVDPDVVVVGGYHALTMPWARRMLEGVADLPSVLYLHDFASAPLAAERSLHINAVAAVSDFTARQAEALGVGVWRIPPGVERSQYKIRSSRRVALLVNPIPDKGVETVWALARARRDIPFAFLCCWYMAPESLEALKVEARALGNVEIRPSVREPAQIYGDAKVLLVPSRYPEAWARVVPEAQMSGIPVLASSIGGIPESMGDGGVLLDPDAPDDAWLRSLSALWDDDAVYRTWMDSAEMAGRRGDLSPRVAGDRFDSLLEKVVR